MSRSLKTMLTGSVAANFMELNMTRKIYTITKEITEDWKNPYFGAKPYIQAMQSLGGIDDYYGVEPAKDIIMYFLANAGTWRGEVARRVKKELNQLIGRK